MEKFADFSLSNYLDKLSSDSAVPGGGSVSAYVGSLAVGLTQMVGRISLNRKKKKGLTPEEDKRDDEMREAIKKIVDSLEKIRVDAFQIVDLDPKVYQEVMDSYKKSEEEQESALSNSFRLQADLCLLVVMAKEANVAMADLVTGSIKNDLLVSASLSEAAFRGAYHTAMINVKYMKDEAKKNEAESALSELKKRFESN